MEMNAHTANKEEESFMKKWVVNNTESSEAWNLS